MSFSAVLGFQSYSDLWSTSKGRRDFCKEFEQQKSISWLKFAGCNVASTASCTSTSPVWLWCSFCYCTAPSCLHCVASHEQEITSMHLSCFYGNSIIRHMSCRGWTQITSAIGIGKKTNRRIWISFGEPLGFFRCWSQTWVNHSRSMLLLRLPQLHTSLWGNKMAKGCHSVANWEYFQETSKSMKKCEEIVWLLCGDFEKSLAFAQTQTNMFDP